jgi:hypothetical protein
MSIPTQWADIIAAFSHGRFGVFRASGEFEELLSNDNWMADPQAYEARWVGGVHDSQLLRSVMQSVAKNQNKELEQLRAALDELIACNDMRDRLNKLAAMGHGTDWAEFKRRDLFAWEVARNLRGKA